MSTAVDHHPNPASDAGPPRLSPIERASRLEQLRALLDRAPAATGAPAGAAR